MVHVTDDPRDHARIREAWTRWSRTKPETFWDATIWRDDCPVSGSLDVANRYEIFAHVYLAALEQE